MKKAMTVTYKVDTALYINVTNKCTNNCEFCIRNNDDGAYGSDPLWLMHEPSFDEVMASVLSHDLLDYTEVVFCGYGEPSMRLELCREVALEIRKRSDIPIRINTNGHSSLYYGYDTAPLYKDAFDTVSISLNTPSPEHYNTLCHPRFDDAHKGLIDFASKVSNYVPAVIMSVVRQTLTEEEIAECRAIADRIGVTLRIREYIA